MENLPSKLQFRRHLGLAACLLLLLAAPVVSTSGKFACPYDNRLCQWSARYAFGGTVLGDMAFFDGGILSNDASTPVAGSAFEVLDLRTMSPMVIQYEADLNLTTSRYRNHLAAWKDKILSVGGQYDDSNGASQQVINVIELDLNTRQWALRKQFTQPAGQVEVIIEAAVVADDQLLVVFVTLDPINPLRNFLTLNLNTQKVPFNYNLASDPVHLFDWPLIGIMTLGQDGNFPHLVVQSKRQLPSANNNVTLWYEVTGQGEYGVEGPLPFNASTSYKKLPGGDGGKVLAMKIFRILDKPRLITWAVTTATFPDGRKETVNAVSMYDVDVSGPAGQRSISLQLSKIFLTLPFNTSDFSGLQSVDLPLHGNLALTAAGVTALPYVGQVDLVGELDFTNINIQEWPGKGFIIRGSSLADHQCQPIASWKPFVLTIDLSATASPATSSANSAIRAVSNNTWCSTRSQQLTASEIVDDASGLMTNAKLFTVDSSEGPMLMMLNMKRAVNPGGQLSLPDTQAPLRGAFISVSDSTVHNFSIPAARDYSYALGFASCVTSMAGSHVYLQTGGQFLDEKTGDQRVDPNFVAVPLQVGKEEQPMLKVGGASSGQGAIFPALACSPDGTVYTFGGLVIDHYENQTYVGEDGKAIPYQEAVWAASNRLTAAKLSGSLTAPALSKPQQLGPVAAAHSSVGNVPSPRNGHTLTYLPAETVAALGLSKGALLLYGGSNVTDPGLSALLQSEVQIASVLGRHTAFDRSLWLYDLGASQWINQLAAGRSYAPPGLMYHSAVVQGKQVLLWGGSRFIPSSGTMRVSTDLYILDFAESTPRWRKAAVHSINTLGGFQLGFPNTGAAVLPQSGVIALMHKSGISLAAIPQSVQTSAHSLLPKWGYQTLNLTAGDWVRIDVTKDYGLKLEKPLVLNSNTNGVLFTAAEAALPVDTDFAEGPSTQRYARPVLQCGGNATTALMLRSSEAVVEGFKITGCNGSGIVVVASSTGYQVPATLRNFHIAHNTGHEGAALYVGPDAAVVLQDCLINDNDGTDSIIHVSAGAQLELVNTNITSNHGSGVVSAGSRLTISGCKFSHNTAIPPGAKATSGNLSPSSSGAAVRMTCGTPVYAGCQASITNSTFTQNRAQSMGGAMYFGANTYVNLVGCTFSGHMATEGGAVYADRSSCLANMTAVHFMDNHASQRGGAVMMRGASCLNNIVWHNATFVKNSASTQGGAMCLVEMINERIFGQAAFHNNMVASAPAADNVWSPTALGQGGGAMYLALWGSNVTIYNTTFVGNNAVGSGGAVEVLSIDYSVVDMINTTAVGNYAGSTAWNNSGMFGQAATSQAATSEGGVVHMQGPAGWLTLSHVNMTANKAGRGGAVSVTTGQGGFNSSFSSFRDNIALIAGGAVAVTEHKAAALYLTRFERNRLLWPHIAAGGGFYCYLCERVGIMGSYFTSNVASFGGGAAILRPFRPSTIVQTAFVDNVAIALPSLMSDDQAQHMRRLLSASSRQLSAAGTELHNTSADFLGPLGNTTGDAAIYSGGGGLYLSVTSLVDIAGSCFSSNVARNGGGLVASTDSCQAYHNKDQPCQLRLWNTSIMLSNNATSAGAGLLITKVDAISVDLGDCQAGNPLNFTTCVASLQKPSKLCPDKPSDWRTAASHTDLLSTPSSSNTADYASEYFVTSAASLKCFQRLSPTGVPQISEDCSDPVAATPGGPIDMVVQLYDGLARPVYGGVDGKMSLEVVIFNPDGITRPNFFLIGNTTQAVNGSGYFPGLRINGSPGTHYLLSVRTPSSELAFRTKNGLSRTRPLLLRECQPGEHNSTQKVLSEESYTCEPCGSPQYSFYPQAQTCGSCPMLGLNRYSICNMAAVVPADGMYQSHPRNPLLHRCITAAACSRSSDTPDRMADWAAQHAGKNITQLNQVNNATGQPYYQPYMELMCASGYTGPLCGACSPGYGHSSYRCVKCMNSSANSFCYFMVCLFMFLVPALQTLLHSKDIQKRHKQHRQTAGLGLRLGSARSTSLALGPQGSFQEGLKPSLIAEQGSGVIEQLQQDKNVELVSTEGLGNQRLYGQGVTTVDDTAATQDRDQSHVVLSLTPYNGNSVPAAAAVHAVDSSNTSRSRDSEVSGHVQQMSHTRTGAIMDIGTFSRGADAATQGLPSGSMQQQQQQPPTRTQAADAEPKQPAGLLSAMFSTRPLHRADTVVKRSGSAATPLSSTGVPASAAVSKSAGSSADVKSAGLSAAAGCAGTPHLRFYHTDVLTMLVSYMQLLGLLRLIELDWREWLKAVQSTLTYLDFTSGVSTWVSVECSFSDAGLLPKSLKRSLVLLMWPLVALLFLAIIWLSYAYISTHFRRSPHRLMSLIRRLVPYMVLSALTIVYYLYTPTSREILTLFSCQPVDTIEALQGIAPEYNSTPDAVDALLALTPASSRWQGVWMSDTNVSCSSPAHMGIALGLGIPGLIFWVFGVPIALWVVLKRNSRSNEEGVSKLEDPKVELMFGVFYEKYRYKRYYWECVVLLQNCTLTMLLVLLQPQPAALQVLVAMAVIFIFIVLQVSFKPYAVQLLDTLRQLAMYALLATLFCMMLVSLTELQQRSGLPLAALIVIFLLNLGVVLLHIWAICSELSRWIVYEQLTWGGIGQRFRQALLKVCGGKLAGVVNRLHRPPVPASRPGMGPV